MADFKLINIVNGLQSSSATYPCPYGKCKKPSKREGWIRGEDRTIKSIIEDQEAWVQNTNGNRTLLKNYYSSEKIPLINFNLEEKVINIYPPPPIHTVRLGVLNKVYDELTKQMNLEDFER